MSKLGDPLPNLSLHQVVDGPAYNLSELRERIVVIDFWSVECPWSRAADDWLNEHYAGWSARDVQLLAVASNSGEDRVHIREVARTMRFPIVRDPGHLLADALGATHTPHVFVYRHGRLAYKGALDDRSFRRRAASVNYLSLAVEALLAGRAPDPAQTHPYGCTLLRADAK